MAGGGPHKNSTVINFFLLLVGSMPSLAQTVSSYEANREVLKSLLEDLQNKIDQADERMIAHTTSAFTK